MAQRWCGWHDFLFLNKNLYVPEYVLVPGFGWMGVRLYSPRNNMHLMCIIAPLLIKNWLTLLCIWSMWHCKKIKKIRIAISFHDVQVEIVLFKLVKHSYHELNQKWTLNRPTCHRTVLTNSSHKIIPGN